MRWGRYWTGCLSGEDPFPSQRPAFPAPTISISLFLRLEMKVCLHLKYEDTDFGISDVWSVNLKTQPYDSDKRVGMQALDIAMELEDYICSRWRLQISNSSLPKHARYSNITQGIVRRSIFLSTFRRKASCNSLRWNIFQESASGLTGILHAQNRSSYKS